MEPAVRPFRPADCAAVYRIAADTAFFGAPIESYLEDRSLFLDAFYRYYTHYEPEHAWVAVAGDEVVGFLTGCFDAQRQAQISRQEVTPYVRQGLLRGRYRIGRLGLRYAWRLALSSARKEFPGDNLDGYPAHLHINLSEGWRGQGLGRRLLEAYYDQLREGGIPGVHLHTTSLNQAACRLYERTGFRLYSEHPTRIWQGLVAEPVSGRCYVRTID